MSDTPPVLAAIHALEKALGIPQSADDNVAALGGGVNISIKIEDRMQARGMLHALASTYEEVVGKKPERWIMHYLPLSWTSHARGRRIEFPLTEEKVGPFIAKLKEMTEAIETPALQVQCAEGNALLKECAGVEKGMRAFLALDPETQKMELHFKWVPQQLAVQLAKTFKQDPEGLARSRPKVRLRNVTDRVDMELPLDHPAIKTLASQLQHYKEFTRGAAGQAQLG